MGTANTGLETELPRLLHRDVHVVLRRKEALQAQEAVPSSRRSR
jgi:hypothetical protein